MNSTFVEDAVSNGASDVGNNRWNQDEVPDATHSQGILDGPDGIEFCRVCSIYRMGNVEESNVCAVVFVDSGASASVSPWEFVRTVAPHIRFCDSRVFQILGRVTPVGRVSAQILGKESVANVEAECDIIDA